MIKLASDGIMRGAGAVRYFVMSTFSDLLLRVILAYILSPIYGVRGIWYSWPIGWTISAGLVFFVYVKGYWLPASQRRKKKDQVKP